MGTGEWHHPKDTHGFKIGDLELKVALQRATVHIALMRVSAKDRRGRICTA